MAKKERTNTPQIVIRSASKNQLRLTIKGGNGEQLSNSQALDSVDNVVNNLDALIDALLRGKLVFSKRGISDEQRQKFYEVLRKVRGF